MLKAVIELVSTNKTKVGNHSRETRRGITDFYYKNTIIVSLNPKEKKVVYNFASTNPAILKAVADYREYLGKIFTDYEHVEFRNN